MTTEHVGEIAIAPTFNGLHDDHLQCKMCLQQFNYPERLPLALSCLHTFCEPCIVSWTQNKIKGKLTCPICGKQTKIEKGGRPTDILPINHAVLELVAVTGNNHSLNNGNDEGNWNNSKSRIVPKFLSGGSLRSHMTRNMANNNINQQMSSTAVPHFNGNSELNFNGMGKNGYSNGIPPHFHLICHPGLSSSLDDLKGNLGPCQNDNNKIFGRNLAATNNGGLCVEQNGWTHKTHSGSDLDRCCHSVQEQTHTGLNINNISGSKSTHEPAKFIRSAQLKADECEKCGYNAATVTVTSTSGSNGPQTTRLCNQCHEKRKSTDCDLR